jgi:DNA-binding IscR family transcriptional regulator
MVKLPGKAGWVGLAIYRLTVMRKEVTVTINCRQLAAQIGVNPKVVYNALTLLERVALITTKRGRGSFAEVTMLVEPET